MQRVINLEYNQDCAKKVLGKNYEMGNNELKYYETMFKLIENVEGQIENGLFVVKPGVDIISITNFNDNEFPINDITSKHTFITFAINGVSIYSFNKFILIFSNDSNNKIAINVLF